MIGWEFNILDIHLGRYIALSRSDAPVRAGGGPAPGRSGAVRPDLRRSARCSSYAIRRLVGAVADAASLIVAIAFFMMRLAPGGPFDKERARAGRSRGRT